jgi:hypothetical protein
MGLLNSVNFAAHYYADMRTLLNNRFPLWTWHGSLSLSHLASQKSRPDHMRLLVVVFCERTAEHGSGSLCCWVKRRDSPIFVSIIPVRSVIALNTPVTRSLCSADIWQR